MSSPSPSLVILFSDDLKFNQFCSKIFSDHWNLFRISFHLKKTKEILNGEGESPTPNVGKIGLDIKVHIFWPLETKNPNFTKLWREVLKFKFLISQLRFCWQLAFHQKTQKRSQVGMSYTQNFRKFLMFFYLWNLFLGRFQPSFLAEFTLCIPKELGGGGGIRLKM